jgi:hypothetical protein
MPKLKLFLLWFAIFQFPTSGKAQHGSQNMAADRPAVHGMLIFGTEKIYASHLPFFHPPHNYQVILELALDKTAKQNFIEDQATHPAFTTYTIEPETFVLPAKIAGKGSFKANLYRGHFERGGVKIADGVRINIVDVLYFKKFDTAELRQHAAAYLIFGNNKEQFAVHQISNKPDFEQIIQIKTDLEAGKLTTVIFSVANTPVGVGGNEISIKIDSKERKLLLLKQLYLEFDDLND